ncbi:MAG: DUF1080 domain-containing protein [Bacteroidota bacterium]
MKKTFIPALLLIAGGLYAQEPGKDPKTTEVWAITPPVVTPGKSWSDVPSDAEVIFDGKDLSNWTAADGKSPAKWEVKDGVMTVVGGSGDIKTKNVYGDVQLHIEWRAPEVVKGDGQGRGNSGIFFHEKYELQVLDNYNNATYPNGQAGSIYKQSVPLVNACRKPGEWQSYDIIFISPRFSDNGRVIVPARITVLHNGIVVQNNTEIWGPSQYIGLPYYESHGKGSLRLQDHGDKVSYRNIWLRKL